MPSDPAALWLSLGLALSVATAAAQPVEPKTEYRIYLLARDPAKDLATANHADPIYGLVGDLRHQIESLGAKVEKTGTFNTPKADGGLRGNDVTVWTAAWTKAQYDQAAALARGVDLVQLKIEPAANPNPAHGSHRHAVPSSVADIVADRVRKEIGIALPASMFTGDGRPFDGTRVRDSVAADLTSAASRQNVPLASLPRAQPAPARPGPTAVPSPNVNPTPLLYDAYIEKAAAASGVSADVLRSLMFASQGYSGGFSKVTGLHGPMGLSRATGRDYGLTGATLDDPAANIAAAAEYYKKVQTMFGGDMSRSVAAFYCGSGAVRASRGIPSECAGYLAQYYLAYQNGAAWAVDHNSPRYRRPVVVPEPVTRPDAVARAGREDAVAAVRGDTPSNRGWHSRIMPQELIDRIGAAIAHNYFDSTMSGLDPDILVGLSWAEGGYSSANKRPNEWGAVGPMQVTYSGAQPHCQETDARGRRIFDWKSISKWDNPKNVNCGVKTFYDRVNWTSTKDPVIAMALYNTKAEHWPGIIASNKVPAFPETVAYVVRATTIACARSGKMLLTQGHFQNATALKLARAEQNRLVKSEFPYEGNEVPQECRIFR